MRAQDLASRCGGNEIYSTARPEANIKSAKVAYRENVEVQFTSGGHIMSHKQWLLGSFNMCDQRDYILDIKHQTDKRNLPQT